VSVTHLPVTLFADFTSPFCFVTEVALARVSASRPIEVRAKSFELHPAPSPLPDPAHDPDDLELARPLAAELEIDMRAPTFCPRTRKAHEAVAFATDRGLGEVMRAALYSAYWRRERDIGRIDVLMEIAAEVGMDPMELKIALDIDLFREDVLADETLARRLGVVGVPTLYLGRGEGAAILQGALSVAALDAAVRAS
jgi:predicted DsbA family dithiol-disulfide isomerase